MAKKIYDKKISKHSDWGGDASTENLPVSGRRVQEFIKEQLENKIGILHYDTFNNKYLAFADEENKDLYLNDPINNKDLLMASFDAPFNYTASITMLSPMYNIIQLGAIDNFLRFTFDIVNKQGQSIFDNVYGYITFINGNNKKQISTEWRAGQEVNMNIDEYLLQGLNTITINIIGKTSYAATTLAVSYNVINLHLEDEMDISTIYKVGENLNTNLEIPFKVKGSNIKHMEWFLDNQKLPEETVIDTITTIEATRTKYININSLEQGKHSIQFRVYTIINEEKFYSNTLYRDFIVVKDEDDTNHIITAAFTLPPNTLNTSDTISINATQYEDFNLVFSTYNNLDNILSVTINNNDSIIGSLNIENNKVYHYNIPLLDIGTNNITIRTSNCTYSFNIEVEKSSLSLEEITDRLQLSLSAVGKLNNSIDYNKWEYNSISTTFNNFQWNTQSGWNGESLVIGENNSIDINLKPLDNQVLNVGKTLEFEFSTKEVSNDDYIILDLTNNNTGLKITASEAIITSSSGKTINTKFKSGEFNRVSFVINKKDGVSDRLLCYIYINGIKCGAVNYGYYDNYIVDKTIKFIGSSDCKILLRYIRIYNMALSDKQILNNYALYRIDSLERKLIIGRNAILEQNSDNIDYQEVANQLPVMIVTGEIPVLEATTDKNKAIIVDIEYINRQNPKLSFKIKNGVMTPQGTSSMGYPKKNFRFYTQKRDDTILYDSFGNIVPERLYAMNENSIPVKCWCLKADYAESSGTHNTGIAVLWNDLLKNVKIGDNYVCRTNAQTAAIINNYQYDVRTAIDGFPIAMFYRLTPTSPLVFIGKYNFNNDKSTENVFGFKDIPGFDNSKMQCWEVLNNGHPLALFTDVSNFDRDWKNAYESRYPNTKNPDTTDLKSFCNWVATTTNFRLEKWEHLNVYNVAAYYIYLMRFGAVDQVVKNSMLTSEDGKHFYFIHYDNDTINGLRNDGPLIYNPFIDRQSLDTTYSSTVYAYAGHDSKLWNQLEADEEFMSIVREVDNALFNSGLTYNNTIKIFNEHQSSKWCETIYNRDSQYKYINPFIENNVNNLYMLQGDRASHRKWWLSKRFSLFDSMFVTGDYKSDSIEFKLAAAPMGLQFSITAGNTLYYGYGINNVIIKSGIKLNAGEATTFTTEQVLNVGDPVRIYGSPNIKEFDLSNLSPYLSTINIERVLNPNIGTSVEKLILGKSDNINTSVNIISGLNNATKLKHLDITGFKSLINMDLTSLPKLSVFNGSESGIKSILFAESSPLNNITLPTTINSLLLNNSNNLENKDLNFEGGIKTLNNLTIIHCKKLDTLSLFDTWFNTKEYEDFLCTIRLEGIKWTNLEADKLIEYGRFITNGGNLILKGSIRLNSITEEQIDIIKSIYGNNVFNNNSTLHISAPGNIYISGSDKIAINYPQKYKATVISQEEGTIRWIILSGNGNITSDGILSVTSGYSITIKCIFTSANEYLVKEKTISIVNTININNINIIGSPSIKELKDYTYNLNITYTSNNINNYYLIPYTIKWEILNDSNNIIDIISSTNQESLIIKPSKIIQQEFTIRCTITNHFYNSISTIVKDLNVEVLDNNIIITLKSNPGFMKYLYAKGYSRHEDRLIKEDAEIITTLSNTGLNNNGIVNTYGNITELECLQYFTSLTNIPSYLFKNTILNNKNIIIPPNVTIIESNAFYGVRYTNFSTPYINYIFKNSSKISISSSAFYYAYVNSDSINNNTFKRLSANALYNIYLSSKELILNADVLDGDNISISGITKIKINSPNIERLNNISNYYNLEYLEFTEISKAIEYRNTGSFAINTLFTNRFPKLKTLILNGSVLIHSFNIPDLPEDFNLQINHPDYKWDKGVLYKKLHKTEFSSLYKEEEYNFDDTNYYWIIGINKETAALRELNINNNMDIVFPWRSNPFYNSSVIKLSTGINTKFYNLMTSLEKLEHLDISLYELSIGIGNIIIYSYYSDTVLDFSNSKLKFFKLRFYDSFTRYKDIKLPLSIEEIYIEDTTKSFDFEYYKFNVSNSGFIFNGSNYSKLKKISLQSNGLFALKYVNYNFSTMGNQVEESQKEFHVPSDINISNSWITVGNIPKLYTPIAQGGCGYTLYTDL